MKTAKYKKQRSRATTRKAPVAHATDTELGRIMYVGKHKQPWIVEAAGKSQRWNRATGYFTHDNGSRPFYVKIRDGKVIILRAMYDKKSEESSAYGPIYNKVVYTIPAYEKVWVGANKGKYANKHEGENVGSSVLIHVRDLTYVYIGDRVFEFKAPEAITEFHGIMGNSDVVYAFAKGDENTYFFASDVSYLPNTAIRTTGDPYEAFYGDATVQKIITPLKGKMIAKRV